MPHSIAMSTTARYDAGRLRKEKSMPGNLHGVRITVAHEATPIVLDIVEKRGGGSRASRDVPDRFADAGHRDHDCHERERP